MGGERERERKRERSKKDEEVKQHDKKKINCLNYLYARYQAACRRCLAHATHKYAFKIARMARRLNYV
jgi:hypothetical protein